jgi:hypothetical protein
VLPVAPLFETRVKIVTLKKQEIWRVLVKLVTLLGVIEYPLVVPYSQCPRSNYLKGMTHGILGVQQYILKIMAFMTLLTFFSN